MDFLCPGLEDLVACHNCREQTLPPYRLCAGGHPACPPCRRYTRGCRTCGQPYADGQCLLFDWTVSAMRLRCKYWNREPCAGRAAAVVVSDGGDAAGADECYGRWFGLQELREHYRYRCARNVYACPLDGCTHVDRVDTVLGHYETAHGPFRAIEPEGRCTVGEIPFRVTLPVPALPLAEVVQKIFNGYFLFTAKQVSTCQPPVTVVSITNVNPSDPLRYGCEATTTTDASRTEFTGVMHLNW